MKLHFVAAILLIPAAAEAHFKCDTPDEWLFQTGNGTGINNFWPGTKWPNGIVKYELHSSLTPDDRVEVQKAFDHIQSKTCIRFLERSAGETAYTQIVNDPTVCGVGHLCRTGGVQTAKFGGGCRTWQVMVHELGHNLCLGHEQNRKDRDDFLEYRNCDPIEIPGKDEYSDLRGSLYDYGSCMHYGCGSCSVGWPKQGDNIPCGNDGLSVMDADKLNEFYDCKGCLRHRWRPIDALTEEDRRNMMPLGVSIQGPPLYACRAMIGGELAGGKYYPDWSVCYIPYQGREYRFFKDAQVFTVPGLAKGRSIGYGTKHVNSTDLLKRKSNIFADAVPAGRTVYGDIGYIATASITDEFRVTEQSVGKVFSNGIAYFPYGGREIQVRSGYSIVTCGYGLEH